MDSTSPTRNGTSSNTYTYILGLSGLPAIPRGPVGPDPYSRISATDQEHGEFEFGGFWQLRACQMIELETVHLRLLTKFARLQRAATFHPRKCRDIAQHDLECRRGARLPDGLLRILH